MTYVKSQITALQTSNTALSVQVASLQSDLTSMTAQRDTAQSQLAAATPTGVSNYTGAPVISYGKDGAGIYAYIIFYASGAITFSKSETVSFLLIGGGGGGGASFTGGGAGGVVKTTASVTAGTSYSIVIGAGGNGGAASSGGGYNGASSTAFGYTAYGGGGGAASNGTYLNLAGPVGSGGGAYVSTTRQAPTSGQGNYGGYAFDGGAGGPWGYGTFKIGGAGGSYSAAIESADWTFLDNYSNTRYKMAAARTSSYWLDMNPTAVINASTMGYKARYIIIDKGSINQTDWNTTTGITGATVGTVFESVRNDYSSYNRIPGYVAFVQSLAGGGGAPTGGSASSGNAGGMGSGGDSGHDTWGNATVYGGGGWGGTGGGGGGSWNGANGGAGGSGICIVKIKVVSV